MDRSLVETYEFNNDGLLTRYYYTNIARTVEKHISVQGRRGQISHQVVTVMFTTPLAPVSSIQEKILCLSVIMMAVIIHSRCYRYDMRW